MRPANRGAARRRLTRRGRRRWPLRPPGGRLARPRRRARNLAPPPRRPHERMSDYLIRDLDRYGVAVGEDVCWRRWRAGRRAALSSLPPRPPCGARKEGIGRVTALGFVGLGHM